MFRSVLSTVPVFLTAPNPRLEPSLGMLLKETTDTGAFPRVWFGGFETDKETPMLNLNLHAVRLSRVLQASAAGSLALLILAGMVL